MINKVLRNQNRIFEKQKVSVIMKQSIIFILYNFLILSSCTTNTDKKDSITETKDSLAISQKDIAKDTIPLIIEVTIEKKLLYDQHTLEDKYPYKDTTREFQWDKIKKHLIWLETVQQKQKKWAILQNYKNRKGEAPLVKNYHRNVYKRVADTLGVERYQSVPLYLSKDLSAPELYGRDGSLVKLIANDSNYVNIATVDFEGEWIVPTKYVKPIHDTVIFKNTIFVDCTNQNITTLEKSDGKWLIRSMNPATTGLHKPPYAQETPLGTFVIQEKKQKMIFLVDGSVETGGFAPYASRFTNGGYIHGVPVNAPRTSLIEYSPSLGTTPRSHMCVRNATSHAKFIYEWAPIEETIVFVFD